jgi:hypothetical protein
MIYVYVVRKLNIKNVAGGKMDKIDKDEIDKDALLGNILVRLTVLEKLLMEKNILLPEDLAREA